MSLLESLHEEKLWLLQQAVIIPSVYEKRLSKIRHLNNSSNDSLSKIGLNTDKQIYILESKKGNLFHFLENYDANLNKLKHAFMSAEEIESACSVLRQIIDLEWSYYEQIETNFNLEDFDEVDIPSRDRLEAFQFAELLKSGESHENPRILKEIQRVKKLLRIQRK